MLSNPTDYTPRIRLCEGSPDRVIQDNVLSRSGGVYRQVVVSVHKGTNTTIYIFFCIYSFLTM